MNFYDEFGKICPQRFLVFPFVYLSDAEDITYNNTPLFILLIF
jgi:hypothetical protein